MLVVRIFCFTIASAFFIIGAVSSDFYLNHIPLKDDASSNSLGRSKVCKVPKYAPYAWVKDVTANEIFLGLTDPNVRGTVTNYTIFYWGHRFALTSSNDKSNRHFGQCNIDLKGPFVIPNLKAGFVYCADITANNDCGHGPFCIACFENIHTLQK